MKNCSYCGRENKNASVACLECGTEFESSPAVQVDPQLEDPPLSLVIVATFRNVLDAGLFKARLEAAGIEACTPEEFTPQIFWDLIPSLLERMTVRVAAENYEAAQALFAEYVDTSLTAARAGASESQENSTSEDAKVEEATCDVPGRKLCVACEQRFQKMPTFVRSAVGHNPALRTMPFITIMPRNEELHPTLRPVRGSQFRRAFHVQLFVPTAVAEASRCVRTLCAGYSRA